MTGKEKLEEIVKECEMHEITESDAKDVLALIESKDKLLYEYKRMIDTATKALKNATAIIKAQPDVVRCKDCKHRPTYPEAYGAEIDGKWCYWCELHRAWKHDDWFCADGKRNIE